MMQKVKPVPQTPVELGILKFHFISAAASHQQESGVHCTDQCVMIFGFHSCSTFFFYISKLLIYVIFYLCLNVFLGFQFIVAPVLGLFPVQLFRSHSVFHVLF